MAPDIYAVHAWGIILRGDANKKKEVMIRRQISVVVIIRLEKGYNYLLLGVAYYSF